MKKKSVTTEFNHGSLVTLENDRDGICVLFFGAQSLSEASCHKAFIYNCVKSEPQFVDLQFIEPAPPSVNYEFDFPSVKEVVKDYVQSLGTCVTAEGDLTQRLKITSSKMKLKVVDSRRQVRPRHELKSIKREQQQKALPLYPQLRSIKEIEGKSCQFILHQTT